MPLLCDAPKRLQMHFAESASPTMHAIIALHHEIAYMLLLILLIVAYMLMRIILTTSANASTAYMHAHTRLELI